MPELTLFQALAELPDTPDGIADRMRVLGIKGYCGDAYNCPIANWLLRPDTGYEGASVGDIRIEVCDDDSGFQDAPMPPAVAEFVRRFDAGVYLDLVEPQTSGVTQ